MSPNSRASLIRSATSRRFVGREMLDLRLQLLQPFLGDQSFTSHVRSSSSSSAAPAQGGLPAQKRPKARRLGRARARAGRAIIAMRFARRPCRRGAAGPAASSSRTSSRLSVRWKRSALGALVTERARRTRGRTCAGCAPRARRPSAPRRGRAPSAARPRSPRRRRRRSRAAGQLGEDPRVAEGAAGDHHRVGARLA